MPAPSAEAVAIAIADRFANPRIVVGGNHGTPSSMLDAIDEAVPEYRLWVLNAQPGVPDRAGVVLETCFVGPGMRHSPRLRYVPSRLSLVPVLLRSTLVPDVVVVQTSLAHEGSLSLGIEVNVLPAAIEQCRSRGGVVVAQSNSFMPYIYGDGELPLETFDYVVQVDQPLPEVATMDVDETSHAIGTRVAALVADGSTVQLGIGAVPDAALSGMTTRRGLKIWSEMFSDGVLALDQQGALDVAEPLVASFVFGSAALYDWVDRNERVRLLRTETTNNPANIAARPQMVSVNSALQVDLFGQANASRINERIYSGFGGQTDFIVGALHSSGGRAVIAMKSWHPKADCSTIVPLIDEPVTSFQHSAVVTENGTADIWGYSQQEQAAHLIEQAAHPAVREELWEEAAELGLA
ncbi:MAG TPA: acetyl-CoA hydrolase/transferase C-terminal domain-containing protein [Actinomycetes bacterium]|nr:acetyl-CoA hydrolase/transferase C-terminal domain-containing protein [Actinomycetes bacterium]